MGAKFAPIYIMRIDPSINKSISIATMLDLRYNKNGEECILVPGQTALFLNTKKRKQQAEVLLSLYNVAYATRVRNANLEFGWFPATSDLATPFAKLSKLPRAVAGCDCGMITYKLSSGAPGIYSTRLAASGAAMAVRQPVSALKLAIAHRKARAVDPDLCSKTLFGSSSPYNTVSSWRPKIYCRSTPESSELAAELGLDSVTAYDVVTEKVVTIDELPIPLLLSPFDEYFAAADRYTNEDIMSFQTMWSTMVADLLKKVKSYELFIYREEPLASIDTTRCYSVTEYNATSLDDTMVADACSINSATSGSLRRWVRTYYADNDSLFTLDDDVRYEVNEALCNGTFVPEFVTSI